MKFCPHCGKQLQFERAEICTGCGCRVNTRFSKSNLLVAVILIAIFTVLCIIAVGLFQIFPGPAGKTTQNLIDPVITTSEDSSLFVTWTRMDDWSTWEHSTSWSGKMAGPCTELGPRIVDGHGEYGTNVSLYAGSTEASVWRTFSDPSGVGWNTLTLVGSLSASDTPTGRWMKIEVNNKVVFSSDATNVPPGNGIVFTIPVHFPQSKTVKINISNGQDPAWGGSPFQMGYYSMRLSLEKNVGT